MPRLRRELAELYDEFGQQLFGCAMAVTRSGDLAEDAVHDAFCRAFRLTERPRNLKAYVFRSVRNAAVDIMRRQSRNVQPISDDFFESSATQDMTVEGFSPEDATEALAALSDDQRETVIQHLMAGLTFREIAELRERPIGTVATWYQRGIGKLRRRMRTHDGSL